MLCAVQLPFKASLAIVAVASALVGASTVAIFTARAPATNSDAAQAGGGQGRSGQTAGGQTAGSQTSGGQGTGQNTQKEQPPPSPPSRGQILETIVKDVLNPGWGIVALIVLGALYVPLRDLVIALSESVRDQGGITLDVVGVVKLQVPERSTVGFDDRPALISPSPLVVEEGPVLGGPTPLREVVPQLAFAVSDYVAQFRAATEPADTRAMRDARADLAAACEQTGIAEATIRTKLFTFVHALERSRFLEASKFATLLRQAPILSEILGRFAPADATADPDQWIALNAAAVAYAEAKNWGGALEILARIARAQDGRILYPPAGSVWLACQYNAYVKGLEDTDTEIETSGYGQKVRELTDVQRRFIDAIRGSDWTKLSLHAPKGYYLREALKDLGNVLGLAAAYGPRGDRREMFNQSFAFLSQCARLVEHEAPSPMDHNNLGDLYRQLAELETVDRNRDQAVDYYRRAHASIDAAFNGKPKADPAFHDTRAQIFRSEGKPREAIEALEAYTQADAETANALDIAQYVRNQLLIVKLRFGLGSTSDPPDFARIVSTLDNALAFVDAKRAFLGDKEADGLTEEVSQLLGFSCLAWRGHERQAIQAFERFFDLCAWPPPTAMVVRCRIGSAIAHIRLARQHRIEFSRAESERLRNAAAKALDRVKQITDTPDDLPTAPKTSPGHLQRNLRLRLDAAVAYQMLAEEQLAAEETKRAKELSETAASLVAPLTDRFTGDDVGEVARRISQLRARRSFLAALAAIHADPTIEDRELLPKVISNLNEARGINPEMDARIDLALGQLLLSAARLGKGEAPDLYRSAIAALERAAGRDSPVVRAETIAALSAAYAARASILRKKPAVTAAAAAK
jgi:hypothetical protein